MRVGFSMANDANGRRAGSTAISTVLKSVSVCAHDGLPLGSIGSSVQCRAGIRVGGNMFQQGIRHLQQ